MNTHTRPTTELAIGHTIIDGKKRTEITSIEWSRRHEWCIVNSSLVYSYGGSYERPAFEVAGERMAEAADAMTTLGTAAKEATV